MVLITCELNFNIKIHLNHYFNLFLIVFCNIFQWF